MKTNDTEVFSIFVLFDIKFFALLRLKYSFKKPRSYRIVYHKALNQSTARKNKNENSTRSCALFQTLFWITKFHFWEKTCTQAIWCVFLLKTLRFTNGNFLVKKAYSVIYTESMMLFYSKKHSDFPMVLFWN